MRTRHMSADEIMAAFDAYMAYYDTAMFIMSFNEWLNGIGICLDTRVAKRTLLAPHDRSHELSFLLNVTGVHHAAQSLDQHHKMELDIDDVSCYSASSEREIFE